MKTVAFVLLTLVVCLPWLALRLTVFDSAHADAHHGIWVAALAGVSILAGAWLSILGWPVRRAKLRRLLAFDPSR